MSTNEIELLRKALERERKSRELAESFVENRLRELYVNNIHLSNKVVTQEEFQKDLLDNLVDALFVVDLNGKILKINHEATKLLGLKDDYKIENVTQFSNRHKKGIFRLLSKKNLERENEVFYYEFVNLKKEKKYVTIKSKILIDSERIPYAYQAIVRDVTENYLLDLQVQKQQQFEKFESKILKDLLRSNDIFTNGFDLVNHIADFLKVTDCVFYGFINGELIQLAKNNHKLGSNQFINNKLSIPINKGLVGRVARTKKGEIINDLTKDKEYNSNDFSGFSKIIVPVLLDDQVVGIIDSTHPDKNHFAKDTLAALSKISILISLHIKNSASELEKSLKQQELEATKNRLEIIFESYSDAKVIESKEGYIEFVNNAFLNLFKIPFEAHDQLIGLSCEIARANFKGFFRYENKFVTGVEEIIKNQEGVNDEILELKDGRFVSRSYTPILLNGKLDGHVWRYRDVTLQINYDKSLAFQNTKYKNIIENINLGLMEVDNKDTILAVNKAFCTMSGFDSAELIGKKAKNLFLGNEEIEIMNSKNLIRKNGIDDVYEMKVVTKNGESKYWLISGAPNYTITGEVIGSLGIHLDITEIKTLSIKNEKLISDLTESNVELSNYAHIVSHDLKTPLHNIASCIDWIKEDNEGKLSPDSLQFIALINEAIIDMNQLISSTLQYSELRSSQKEDNKTDTQLVVENIITNIDINKMKNVTITIVKPLPVISLNNTKTKQIFQNLIENAYKYRDTKKNSLITINWEYQNDFILFSIQDNGIGIADEYFDLIFQVFKKLNNRTDSSGIGLSIVKNIVETAGGKIWFDSKLNVGTTFNFTIPI